MEIKARLNKPYTGKEKADFIVENNHINGYEIKDTETALEAWGLTAEEKQEIDLENKQKSVRAVRNSYLEETDKYVSVPDFPISEEEKENYKTYRIYLRDYTKLENWWEEEPLNYEDWKEKEAN